MKRLLSIFLAFALMICMVACDSTPKDDPNLGLYQGVSLVMSGETYALSEVYEGTSSLELKADDKVLLTLGGDTIEGTWSLKGDAITLVIDGTECVGTLKDGEARIDFMGMEMSFSMKGGASSGTVSLPTPNIPTLPSSSASSSAASSQEIPVPGYYKLNHYISGTEAGGVEFDLDKLQQLGIADSTFLVLNEDGSGRFVMDGDEGEIASYSETEIVVEDFSFPITTEGDEITLDMEDSGIFTFKYSEEEPPAPGAFLPGASMGDEDPYEYTYFPAAAAERFGGDWHGMAVVSQAEGDLAGNANQQFEVIARFDFTNDGSCNPFIYAALTDDEYNFKDIKLGYNIENGNIDISGTFMKREIPWGSSCMYDDESGVLYVEVLCDDGEGNFAYTIIGMRRLDEEWDYENDYPYLPEGAIEFYQGKDFYEIAELFGADLSLIPEFSGAVG